MVLMDAELLQLKKSFKVVWNIKLTETFHGYLTAQAAAVDRFLLFPFSVKGFGNV